MKLTLVLNFWGKNESCVSRLSVGVARRKHRLLKNCVSDPDFSTILSTIAY